MKRRANVSVPPFSLTPQHVSEDRTSSRTIPQSWHCYESQRTTDGEAVCAVSAAPMTPMRYALGSGLGLDHIGCKCADRRPVEAVVFRQHLKDEDAVMDW